MTEATTRWRVGKGSRAAATSALGCALMPMCVRTVLPQDRRAPGRAPAIDRSQRIAEVRARSWPLP